MLNHKQRFLRWIKQHKSKTDRHVALGLVIIIFSLAAFQFVEITQEVDASDKNDSEMVVSMVGDMMFGRYIEKVVDQKGYEFLFAQVQPYFNNSDLVTGNFEHPITFEEYPKADKPITLNTEKEAAFFLKKAGFTSVNLANNHMMDYRENGLRDHF